MYTNTSTFCIVAEIDLQNLCEIVLYEWTGMNRITHEEKNLFHKFKVLQHWSYVGIFFFLVLLNPDKYKRNTTDTWIAVTIACLVPDILHNCFLQQQQQKKPPSYYFSPNNPVVRVALRRHLCLMSWRSICSMNTHETSAEISLRRCGTWQQVASMC